MWVAAIDFQKASDSMQHGVIWSFLRNCSISEYYTCLFQKLYADQRATVLTDVESDEFGIAHGTNEGDPLSSLLLNSVLQTAMAKLKLGKKSLVITLSDETAYQTYALPTTCS